MWFTKIKNVICKIIIMNVVTYNRKYSTDFCFFNETTFWNVRTKYKYKIYWTMETSLIGFQCQKVDYFRLASNFLYLDRKMKQNSRKRIFDLKYSFSQHWWIPWEINYNIEFKSKLRIFKLNDLVIILSEFYYYTSSLGPIGILSAPQEFWFCPRA